MRIEHLIFSTAIAIFFGMVYRFSTGRELSWIIILSSLVPDLDVIPSRVIGPLLNETGFHPEISSLLPIQHGDFHNPVVLILYSLSVSFLFYPFGFKFLDVFIFSAVGFEAHLLGDDFVSSDAYNFLWALTPLKHGSGAYSAYFYNIADIDVLIWGFIILGFAIVLRTVCERKNWLGELVDTSR